MPLPLLFIGGAAVTGLLGLGGVASAASDNSKAKNITEESNKKVNLYQQNLEKERVQVGQSLTNLGALKVTVLNTSIKNYINIVEKIKNVSLEDTVSVDDLGNTLISTEELKDLKELEHEAIILAKGLFAGTVGGGLVGFGAYSAAMNLAVASTGTAISTLSGAAATNATLAFFGGGSLASGGLGIAGGTTVLGGLVAGPALMVMGLISSAKASANLDDALANDAQANKVCEELSLAEVTCKAINRRAIMFYGLLANLDAKLSVKVLDLKDALSNEGFDYSTLSTETKELFAETTSLVKSVKSVLDVTLLTEEGNLTVESEKLIETF